MYAVIANRKQSFEDLNFNIPSVPTPVYLDDNLETAKKYARLLKSKGDAVRLVKMNKEVGQMIYSRKNDISTEPITTTKFLCFFQIPISFPGQKDPIEQVECYDKWAINEVCKNNPELASLFN